MAHVGKHIRQLRTSKGMTQDELAERLFVSRQTVSNYETGKSHPDLDTLVKLAEILGVDANALLYGPPVPPGRERERRWLWISAAVTVLLGIAAALLRPVVQELQSDYYMVAPTQLYRLILPPALYLTLGWCFLSACLLLCPGRPRGRWLPRTHRALLALLGVGVLLLAPLLLWLTVSIVEQLALLGVPGASYTRSFSFPPIWNEAAQALLRVIFKAPALFLLLGGGLRITKAAAPDGDSADISA